MSGMLDNLLSQADSILTPEDITRAASLTPEQINLLTALASRVNLITAERLAEVEERAESVELVDVTILDVEQWPRLIKSHHAVQAAEAFLRTYFARAVEGRGGPVTLSILNSVVLLMGLGVAVPANMRSARFKSAARHLITELIVAREAIAGVKPHVLASLRGSLQGAPLPMFMQEAYNHTRLMDKLTPAHGNRDDGAFHHPKKPQPKPKKP